ncbi:hypothetical protein AGMMS49928_28030 [Spirochaetia bacterium]|nr:hypothetical protein AGMMS49928_28030 [Spirochaetia bacterium]
MHIDRKDVLWNYTATFLQIAAQVILLPFILRSLPQETVAVWTIFSTIVVLVNLLDFGFNSSFTRNVTYIFSGAKTLKATGFDIVAENAEVDYGLLKGLIGVMRFFYSRMAAILLAVLASAGTYYICAVLRTYTGDTTEVYIAWIILCAINAYSFYTHYYDSLLQGKGLIKRSKQIGVVGQSVYLIAAIILIALGFGLIAIVSAQALSIIIRRVLSHHVFYTVELKERLKSAIKQPRKGILQSVYPNAVKIGLTSIGGFLVSRSAVIIGSMFLPLDVIASYGITVQIIGVISGIAGVYYFTYHPKIVQYKVQNNIGNIKRIYTKSCLILFAVYFVFGACLLFFGEWAFGFIRSKTPLLPRPCIVAALIIAMLEVNHSIAGTLLTAKNEIPFFKASLIFGTMTVVLLMVFFRFLHLGVWGMILAPGVAQGVYQNWKWPLEVYKELRS